MTTYNEPMANTNASVNLTLLLMLSFLISVTGRRMRTKSSTMLKMAPTMMTADVSMHWPSMCLFQAAATGLHWKVMVKRKASPWRMMKAAMILVVRRNQAVGNTRL